MQDRPRPWSGGCSAPRTSGPTVAVTVLVALLAGAQGLDRRNSCAGRVGGAGRAAVHRLEQRPPRPGPRPVLGTVGQAARQRRRVRRGSYGSRVLQPSLATLALSLAVGVAAGLVHLGCVACGWAYNLGLKATVLVVAPLRARVRWPDLLRRAGRRVAAAVVVAGRGRRCSASAPTWSTSCPTSRTTWRPAYAACRTGSARASSRRWPQRCWHWRPSSCWWARLPRHPPRWPWACRSSALVVLVVAGRGRVPFVAAIAIALVDAVLLVVVR